MSQKDLAIFLSKIEVFDGADMMAEQHPTDSEIAAQILWFAYMNNDIEGKTIADLGAGTGILGIGCLMLGAKKVIFVEKDPKAVAILKKNLSKTDYDNYEVICKDVAHFSSTVDVVVQNPPFGTKEKHADLEFLKKAASISKVMFTFHKSETKPFIDKTLSQLKFDMTHYFELNFPLKNTMQHHQKKREMIKVGCWRAKRRNGVPLVALSLFSKL